MSREALIRNVLAVLGRVIASSGDFGAAISEIERLSSEIIEFDGFSIASYNAERRTVRRLFTRGLFLLEDTAPEEFSIDESAASATIQSGNPIRQAFSSVEQLIDLPSSIEAFEAGTRAFLTAPLISNDEIVGVMQFRSASPEAFSEVEVDNSQRIADQIAGALANSLANERIRLQATALESADPQNWGQDAEISSALDNGKSWSGAHINRKKDGSEYPEELTVTPVLDQDGNVTHIIGIKKDIAERLLSEEAHENSLLIESENRELQRLAGARSEFLSTVSHELRTPLTTVSAFADILFNSKSENLTERQLKHIELIRRSSAQLGTLIDDLLDISQADTGHLVLNKAVFNIVEMIDEVAGNAAVLVAYREQKLKIKTKVKNHGLLGDRSRVIQILNNLFTNASKFSDEGSTINFQVDIKREQIAFTVKDRGSGISKSDQAMMFSPFFRGTSDRSLQPDGRGLGLAVVRSLVDLHDGFIVVNSKSVKGTEITVTLPGVTSDISED
jgi:signal transduction histidine kinase